eukprot:TRINITY_DN7780_c0_g3_i1.p1 TRINITY_DN7780_c0_g3~~TRINITY_DN7780_c0_g3_i1.p1  ORF type:complete len:333 (-),score=53.06 TRINITY_DN7780_c0_g3_i1:330-1328(-)
MASGRKEIHTYDAHFPLYGVSISSRNEGVPRLAVSSLIEEYVNKVHVLQFDESSQSLRMSHDITHPYPPSKLMFLPESANTRPDFLATAGDYLRIWQLEDGGIANRILRLDKEKGSEYCAPITSFDWSDINTNMIISSSIDTTCTAWDIQAEKAVTQLIAHDKEVYDVAFHSKSENEFATVGADGSLRLFDLRSLEHSTIMYESMHYTPLLRLSWNPQDPNFIATLQMDSRKLIVIDLRMPSIPVVELQGHTRSINTVCWAPNSACHIATGADDGYVFIWDMSLIPHTSSEPLLAYSPGELPGSEINQVVWAKSNPKWLGTCFGNKAQVLRV